MNKTRLEALSDGVFSIVMTLLIIEIHVPALKDPLSSGELLDQLWQMWPLFRSYYLSFTILGMYWIAHHALFHLYVKSVDRHMILLNTFFLCLVSLIPFSTHLIGQYHHNAIAIAEYGFNVIVIGVIQYWMLHMGVSSPHMRHDTLEQKLVIQGKIRLILTPAFAVGGIAAGFSKHWWLSFFLFMFPVFFNIIPGTLTSLEKFYSKLIKRSN